MSHQDTTEQILDAALAELTEFGLRRTTIEDVTRRAKVGRMTLYRRFPSKEELFKAVVTREMANLLGALQEMMAAQDTLEQAVVEALMAGLGFARNHPLLARLMATDREAVLPYLTVDAQGALAAVAGIMAGVIATRLPPTQAAQVGETLTRIAQSLALTPFVGTEQELRDAATTAVTALLRPP